METSKIDQLRKELDYYKNKELDFEGVFETASNPMRMINRNFEIIHANDAFVTFIGSDKQSIIAKKCYDILPGKSCYSNNCPVKRLLEEKKEIHTEEIDKIHPSGKIVPFKLTARALKNTSGEYDRIIEDFKDLSSEKEYVQTLYERDLELLKSSRELQKTNSELKKNQKELKTKAYELGERLKEMSCLYAITSMIAKTNDSNKLIEEAIRVMPISWQYPEYTVSRIVVGDKIFVSKPFQETKWKQAADLLVGGKTYGTVEVFYTREMPLSDEGPFLKEERHLIDSIAVILSRAMEQYEADETLRLSYQQLDALNQQLTASNQQLVANEQLVKKSLQQFESVFNGIADVMYVSDPETYEVVYVNDETKKIFGNDVVGKKCYRVFQNEDKPCSFCTNDIIFNQKPNEVYVWEFQNEQSKAWYRCADKTILWPDGRRLRFELATDITEIEQTKEKLARSEEQIRHIAENSSEMIYQMSIPDGIYEYVSPASSKIFGYPPETFYDSPILIRELIHPDWHEYFQNEWEKLLKGDMPPYYEYQIIKKDGETRWLRQGNTLLTNDEGKPTRILGIVSDVTDQKEIEKQLSNSIQQYEASNQQLEANEQQLKAMLVKLETAKQKAEESDHLKSAFLANMSHEVRTPMNGIMGFATLLKENTYSGEDQKHFIDLILRSGERMLATINNILAISKIETGQMICKYSQINCTELFRFKYDFFLPEASHKGIELVMDIGNQHKDVFVTSDFFMLDSIISNLLKNAIKYTEQGKIEFGFYLADYKLHGFVRDTGIGIPAERQEAVFERFVQADIDDVKVYEGSGLGLSISKAYADLLKGKLWMKSEEGVGTSFYFWLPMNKPVENKPKPKIDTTSKNYKLLSKTRVLLVEDDPVGTEYLNGILTNKVKKIDCVSNGKEAVDFCKRNAADVVLMDMKMPVMDGWTATKLIKQYNAEIIVIAQTAYALDGDRKKALEAGCDDFISKPINHDKLYQLIEKQISLQKAL